MILTTDRLKLRPLALSDAPAVALLAGDWDVARQTGRIPHPYTLVAADQWIGSLEADEFVRGVEHGGQLIGAVGYIDDNDGTVEIGYWIGKPFWGHGFATEAAARLMEHCFDTEKRKKLTCCHFVDNVASGRVIKKLGFKLTGTGSGWCEARQDRIATLTYERKRPLIRTIRKRAS